MQRWDQLPVFNVLGAMEIAGGTQIPMFGRQGGERLSRDQELVRFVGRHGAVALEHVMTELGVGRTAAYRRIAACEERGFVQRLRLLREEPNVLRATRAGLRFAGLGLRVAVVSPASVNHWLRCASMAQHLALEFGAERILTERELRFAEQIEGQPIASAKLGERPDGRPRLHRPDLAALCEEGRVIAFEVELTPKAPQRLEQLIRAWRRASWVAEVRYYCAPGKTRRGVERAIANTHSQGRVHAMEVLPR
jgi:hypothetical protein